jgi:predicted lipoprotein with Yx(FWY)xxD motif
MRNRFKQYYHKLAGRFIMEGKNMEHKSMRYFLLVAGLFTIMLLGASACAPAPTSNPGPASEYTVMTASKTDLGTYLVDGSGRTLYYFTKDSANKSTAN